MCMPYISVTWRPDGYLKGKSMVVLSDIDIKKRIGSHVIVAPYVEKNVTTVAVDLTLGQDMVFASQPASELVDFSAKKSIAESWAPAEHYKETDLATEEASGTVTLEDGRTGILVQHGYPLLCHTHEFAGTSTSSDLVPHIKARSTVNRAGLSISASGGWGDVGFCNRWGLLVLEASPWIRVFDCHVCSTLDVHFHRGRQ